MRTAWVHTLTTWNKGYFRHPAPAILNGLAAEAAARRDEAARLTPAEAVERATSGILFTAPLDIEQVLLVPQYHCRPINILGKMRGWRQYLYPADVLPPAPGEPGRALLRLSRRACSRAGQRHESRDLLPASQRSGRTEQPVIAQFLPPPRLRGGPGLSQGIALARAFLQRLGALGDEFERLHGDEPAEDTYLDEFLVGFYPTQKYSPTAREEQSIRWRQSSE